MKPLVIYHANCADGFGAAFAAWLKFGDEAEYLPVQYGRRINWGTNSDGLLSINGEPQREVYILDFNFPREIMDQIFALSKRVVWLDHHKSAFEEMGFVYEKGMQHSCKHIVDDKHHVLLNDNKSGAMLAWEYFHPGTEVPLLIQHIDDYDRWQFKLEGTKAFQKALWSYAPWSFEQWDLLGAGGDCFTRDIYAEGEAILRAHEQNVQSVVEGATMPCRLLKAEPKPGGEHWEALFPVDATGLAANCPPHLASDVGHELATESGTFGLLWSMDKDGKIKCSLRSNGDYDVSAIAKVFGGGGHKNAAGFETDINTLMGWLK